MKTSLGIPARVVFEISELYGRIEKTCRPAYAAPMSRLRCLTNEMNAKTIVTTVATADMGAYEHQP